MATLSSPASDKDTVDSAVMQQAFNWLVTLWSGEATQQERQAFAEWHAAHPEHERAWQRVKQVSERLHDMPSGVAAATLRKPVQQGRRKALRVLGLSIAAGFALYAARNSEPWRVHAADYRTATGERRDVTLADGTQLSLNTATAVDIRFDEQQRRIILRAGEILITSAPDPAPQYRPLIVETSQGTVQALGTRFTVRQNDGLSQVAVFEGMVEIQPNANDDASRLNAGQRATFSDMYVSATESADPVAAAWVDGNLIAERMRLEDFLKEVSRYRTGTIRCDAAVADLVVSGVYPVHDTDRILESLNHALPVRVSYATRYWVTVRARS